MNNETSPNQNNKKNFNKYHEFTIIFSGIIFALAIILGLIYQVPVLTYESSISPQYNQYEYTYNFPLTLAVIFANIILTYFMFAIASVISEIRNLNN